jgi:hypothetical protein
MEPPSVQDSKFDRGRMIKDSEDFTLSYNSLVKAYSADKRSSDCDQWRDFSKALKFSSTACCGG